jgi:hypothetical protein
MGRVYPGGPQFISQISDFANIGVGSYNCSLLVSEFSPGHPRRRRDNPRCQNNSSYEILILKERVFSWIAGTSPAMTPSGAPIAEVIRASAADFRVRTPRIGYGVQPFMRVLYQFW